MARHKSPFNSQRDGTYRSSHSESYEVLLSVKVGLNEVGIMLDPSISYPFSFPNSYQQLELLPSFYYHIGSRH